MSLRLKTGPGEPRVFGIRPEMILAAFIMMGVYDELGAQCVITSALDGKHMDGSAHYNGCALDFRTSMLTPSQIQQVLNLFLDRVTSDYFAQIESDHIHVQFKPKRTYTN